MVMKRIARWARTVRPGASAVHRAAVRAGAAAHVRPAAAAGAAAADVRPFSGCAPARTYAMADRHRRFRRGQPKADWPMAMAADRLGGSGHAHRPARCRRDRFRYRLLPSPTACRRPLRRKASAVSTRKPARSWTVFRAMTKSWPTRSSTRASSSARPARRSQPHSRRPKCRCRPALPFADPIRRRFLVKFPGLLRNVLPIEQAAAGRGLFSISPESDGIIRRVPLIMEAQGSLVPSLTMEMLRVVTGASAILVRADEAGVHAVAVPGLEVPTDRNGQFWVHFNKHDPGRYVSAKDVLQGNVPPDRLRRQARAHRHVRDRPARRQDDAGRRGDAGRRSACANPRKRDDQIASVAPQLCHRRRTRCRGAPRACHHRRRADAVGFGRDRARRRPDRRADRPVLVLLRRARPAYRFHLSADVMLADLPRADLRELFPRAEAAPADPVRLRLLSLAAHGRAARALAGEAGARRRGAPHDHPVQRRARLHHHLGTLQGRSAGPHSA